MVSISDFQSDGPGSIPGGGKWAYTQAQREAKIATTSRFSRGGDAKAKPFPGMCVPPLTSINTPQTN